VCVCVRACVRLRVCVCMCMHACMHTCMHAGIHACVRAIRGYQVCWSTGSSQNSTSVFSFNFDTILIKCTGVLVGHTEVV
jgi:hypothetical protein